MDAERTSEEIKKIDKINAEALNELFNELLRIRNKYKLSVLEVLGLLETAKFIELYSCMLAAKFLGLIKKMKEEKATGG
jgi:hypothetical protein